MFLDQTLKTRASRSKLLFKCLHYTHGSYQIIRVRTSQEDNPSRRRNIILLLAQIIYIGGGVVLKYRRLHRASVRMDYVRVDTAAPSICIDYVPVYYNHVYASPSSTSSLSAEQFSHATPSASSTPTSTSTAPTTTISFRELSIFLLRVNSCFTFAIPDTRGLRYAS
jgi:hypothetical protein